jgi:hypothetical protein
LHHTTDSVYLRSGRWSMPCIFLKPINLFSKEAGMRLTILTFTILLAVAAATSESSGQGLSASPSQTIRGQIIKVDGQTYVVQDASGKEVRFHVDGNTMMMDGTQLREGDTITADVTAKGQASYIIPGPARSPGQTRTGGSDSTAPGRNSRLP